MGRKPDEQKQEQKTAKIYCGYCEKGWILMRDEESQTCRFCRGNISCRMHGKMRPCIVCNSEGNEMMKAYTLEIRLFGNESINPPKDTQLSLVTKEVFASISEDKKDPNQVKKDIFTTLGNIDGIQANGLKAREYIAARKLAFILFPDKAKNWTIVDWEAFNLHHDDPILELSQMTVVG